MSSAFNPTPLNQASNIADIPYVGIVMSYVRTDAGIEKQVRGVNHLIMEQDRKSVSTWVYKDIWQSMLKRVTERGETDSYRAGNDR